MRDESAPGQGLPASGVLELIDETDGTRHSFEVLDILVVDGVEYVVCTPVDEEGRAYIFRIQRTKEGYELREIDDEGEWDAVTSAWEESRDE
ncbi:MAG: DUF1292 domain-containing protein [Bacillota bacterium]